MNSNDVASRNFDTAGYRATFSKETFNVILVVKGVLKVINYYNR